MSVRLGKIGYLNVLPIYHPLESGIIENDFSIISGPPSKLNRLMDSGELDISAASSIEYARHPEKYYLVPNIAIGSCGPVQSVLLLSKFPIKKLSGKTILVSSQTHTSAALLRILQSELWKIKTDFTSGDATKILEIGDKPDAILAIGDEALNLRYHPEYSHKIDLGEAWRDLTGLPFIFGLWLVQRNIWNAELEKLKDSTKKLLKAKTWGIKNMSTMCTLAAKNSNLTEEEMCSYFDGLVYDFGPKEIAGLELFYHHLKENSIIESVPKLKFIPSNILK
jgi:chorismate dehydratase